MERIDLHTHSTFSDGTLTPRELIDKAGAIGLRAVALTDHDTLAGLDEAEEEAAQNGVELVNGIEMAANYKNREIHILGLFIDRDNGPLLDALADVTEWRRRRNDEMTKRLKDAGVDVADMVREDDRCRMITRAHFARAIVKAGFCASYSDAFAVYLSPGRPGYAARRTLGLEQTIDLIHGAGGLAVLAHPMLYRLNVSELDGLTGFLKGIGLDAIEAIYSRNTLGDDIFLANLAKKHRLMISGGSDFHGDNKPDIDLGVGYGKLFIPYTLLTDLKRARDSRTGSKDA